MKIVVYDCGWGGEAFAARLMAELPILEVEKAIDWRHGPYCGFKANKIRELAEEALADFIGKVDAIVLASYEATVAALKYLQMKYPEQVFVGMSWPNVRVQNSEVVVMTTDLVRRSRPFRHFRKRLPEGNTVQLCDGWMQAVDDGEPIEQRIKLDTTRTRRLKPKVVVLGCTNLVDIRGEIEDTYTGALVLDGYAKTIKKLCRVLDIRGARMMRE